MKNGNFVAFLCVIDSLLNFVSIFGDFGGRVFEMVTFFGDFGKNDTG